MSKKANLTSDGLLQIINIKASMNLGLSHIIKSNFSCNNITPVDRPLIKTNNILDSNWLAGFAEGE
jgi:hypothetical protein